MAIITRCFCPPLSWCGYRDNILSGSGNCTFSNSAIALCRASRASSLRCVRIASITWSPQVKTGFSDVIGSWKIIAISPPRIFCI